MKLVLKLEHVKIPRRGYDSSWNVCPLRVQVKQRWPREPSLFDSLKLKKMAKHTNKSWLVRREIVTSTSRHLNIPRKGYDCEATYVLFLGNFENVD